MGRLLGSLKDFSAADLGGVAIKAALERAGITGDQVDYVIMGQVLQAGAGQIPARQAAVKGGIPMSVPALTINKVCLSGHRRHRAGRPAHPRRRVRHRRRRRPGVDDPGAAPAAPTRARAPSTATPSSSTRWRTTASPTPSTRWRWARSTEQANRRYDLTREEQDEFAAASHQLAAARAEERRLRRGDHPGAHPAAQGRPDRVHATTRASAPTPPPSAWPSCSPAFAKDGTITAGTASQISDGACAVVVMSAAKAEELGLTWLAEIGAHGIVAGPDATLQSQPSPRHHEGLRPRGHRRRGPRPGRAQRGLRRGRHRLHRELGIDPEKVNVNGGAIALGHPIGMSGARSS